MKIKDIVNRDIVNLTNCEFEPIHIPGSIQPHGFLIGINCNSWKIDFCSGNLFNYLEIDYKQILNTEFKTSFGELQEALVKEYISKNLLLSSSPLRLNLFGKDFLCTIHKSDNIYILEGEPTSENKKLSDVYDQTSQFLSYMNETHTLKELCDMVVKGTREITGYDRVMVYCFDKDYNGEVFAESVRDDLEPFFGLHYPHTDIPPQARDLYMQNLLRLIVDIDYKPVPIYTVDDGNDTKNLNLSLSILRSTSPMHVQYLHNMGVGATLTISLIHKKKLWGLIACHHYSPKNLTPEIRLAAQLQGHFITSQIDIRQSNEEYEISRKSNLALEKINAVELPAKESSFEILVQKPELLELCNASGVTIIINGNIYKNGLLPSDSDILILSEWLSKHTGNTQFFTDKLIDIIPENLLENCDNASGVIYHSLGIDNNNCIIWYRPETLTEVNWAGDPTKAIVKDKNGLSPRNSFKLWREIIKCQSNVWLDPELNAAANYAHAIQKQLNLILMTQEEEKYRKLSEVLKETNSELENINWISTHDLQEPLRKIQLISSRILGKEDEQISENVANSLQRMNNSANRMQTLLVDIMKYTKIQHIDESFLHVNLKDVLKEVLADLQELTHEKNAIIEIYELPDIYGITFLLKQLFANLVQNSLKYSFPDKAPKVTISSLGRKTLIDSNNPSEIFETVQFSDNGIGFEQKFSENIFNIFSRLHNQEEYKGSGVGLALCKKIMQVHKGYIVAEGIPNQGATFTLYFPLEN